MALKASKVLTKQGDFENVSVLRDEDGVYLKDDNKLIFLYHDQVHMIEWEDLETIKKVWTQALVEIYDELFDEEEWEIEEPKPEKADSETSADDPKENPYG